MAKSKKKTAPFPTKREILAFIDESDKRVGKREIARAFNLDADQKVKLKKVLKELEASGDIVRGHRRRFGTKGSLPEVSVVRVTGINADGDVIAEPEVWEEAETERPKVYIVRSKRGRGKSKGKQADPDVGDRVLARLRQVDDGVYEGNVIHIIAGAPSRILGVVTRERALRSVERGRPKEFVLEDADRYEPGEMILAEMVPGRGRANKRVRALESVGSTEDPKYPSLLAIHAYGIPHQFPRNASAQAKDAVAAPLDKRTDLREMPLVTIDGEDARDFDDAVFAEPDDDEKNPGGWHMIVAIADVAWYVRPGDALDKTAFERGNSVYFPDRVVPMLPEELSNGWCSLKPDEDRPCLAVHIRIDRNGHIRGHKFVRGMMRSAARLTYTQVQAARDGNPDDATAALMESVIKPLYGAYGALDKARRKRGVLELDIPERRVAFDEDGEVAGVVERERFDSHKLIEEFMIAANVCAAEALEKAKQPPIYRVHDEPAPEKVEALREVLKGLGMKLPRGQVLMPEQFNRIIQISQDAPHARLVSEIILRTQAQAEYNPENFGHFGLALRRYVHFTSPIRRYADLMIHRALITGLNLGPGGLPKHLPDMKEVAQHISVTERRAVAAERDAMNRFVAKYMAAHVGEVVSGAINGVSSAGIFVTLEKTGADGFIPMRTLTGDYYHYDEAAHCLIGRRTGEVFTLGDPVDVRVREAEPITGSVLLELIDHKQSAKSVRKALKEAAGKPGRRGKGKRRR